MKTSLSQNDITRIYQSLISQSRSYCNHNKYLDSIKYLRLAAKWMYNFNTIYSDNKAEKIIQDISLSISNKTHISNCNENNVVFIDNFGLPNRGLTQQYLRSLMSLNKKIIYILHNDNPLNHSDIINELSQYNDSKIYILKDSPKNRINTSNSIISIIKDYKPKNLFLHLSPWDTTTLTAIANIDGLKKYNINLTDHAYWLGASLIDYNLEFRIYGEVCSIEKRSLDVNQIVRMPYYPITPQKSSFQGFPQIPEDSIIILTGGSEYKMLGKNDIFFNIIEQVLSVSSKIHIMVAGINPDSIFNQKIQNLKNAERVHLIGNRTDINEVFKNSDIYLSTYPFIGGLMAQYAALNSLPIIAYGEDDDSDFIESIVNQKNNSVNTLRSLSEISDYTSKLVSSKQFRLNEGEKNRSAIITEAEFNDNVLTVLRQDKTPYIWESVKPNYHSLIKYYLDVENNNLHNGSKEILKDLGFKSLIVFPKKAELIKLAFYLILKKMKK